MQSDDLQANRNCFHGVTDANRTIVKRNTSDRIRGDGRVLTSQPQPEPWIEAVVALNSFLKASTVPQFCSMADLRGPSLMAPPLPLPSDLAGARFFQKSEWLM